MPAAKKTLTTYVWVSDEQGNPVGFGPGDTVPTEYADKVGEHCYAKPTESDESEASASK